MAATSLNIRYLPKRSAGFTLLELMITVVIVALLAAVALPSYEASVTKSWRRKASACLIELAQGLERRFTTTFSYLQPDEDGATAVPAFTCTTDDGMTNRYLFEFADPPTANAFLLQAVPQGRQANQDIDCGTLSISQTGERQTSGPGVQGNCF